MNDPAGDVTDPVICAAMIEGRRGPGRLVAFLSEHAGAAFCVECLANALALPREDVRAQVTEGGPGPGPSVATTRGRCSVCRAESLVARHRPGV